MVPPEVIKNIRKVQIRTSRLATDLFSGHYHSVFKGRGMEFDEVRLYQPGDDIRTIDWNVTARTGVPFIKKFVEERELVIMLVLDLSRSCSFATAGQLKRALAAEISCVLALSAIKNNDKTGLIAFTDRIETFVPPGKGVRHVLRVLRDAMYFIPEGTGTDLSGSLEFVRRVTARRAIVFVLSDFHAQGYKKALSSANKRHDVIAVTITDPAELKLPDAGLIELEDGETGVSFLVDTSDRTVRRQYEERAAKRMEERKRLLASINVDHIDVRTNIPYDRTLVSFFRMRERRINR